MAKLLRVEKSLNEHDGRCILGQSKRVKTNGFFTGDEINNTTTDGKFNIGPIQVSDYSGYPNTQYEMVANADIGGTAPRFGANWLNLSIFFPQTGYAATPFGRIRDVRTSDFLATQWDGQESRNAYFVFDNSMPIAAGNTNTKWFGRSDLHWTDIIEVPLDDIVAMKGYDNKGFTNQQVGGLTLLNYRNGTNTPPTTDWKGTWSAPCPFNGGKTGGNSSGSPDSKYYFYKGFAQADCIEWLYELGLVTE